MKCMEPGCAADATGYNHRSGMAFCETHRPAADWTPYPASLIARQREHQRQLFPREPGEDVLLPSNEADTSRKAAHEVREAMRGVRKQVFLYLAGCGERGATCEQVEQALGLKHQTASAAINKLRFQLDLVEDSGRRRRTSSGRHAAVYIVAENV